MLDQTVRSVIIVVIVEYFRVLITHLQFGLIIAKAISTVEVIEFKSIAKPHLAQ